MNSIIVTVTDKKNRFMFDMDVPTDLPGMKLAEDVMEVLNERDPELYLNARYHCFYLNRQGRILSDRETLAEAGVWNGDYMTITSRM